jgi:Protein of unknown function (DUF2752)
MSNQKTRLYVTLSIACIAAYVYLFINVQQHYSKDLNLCIIKNSTGIACPSCGSTRAIELILNEHYIQALYLNPLSYLILVVMLILPVILLYDFILKKDIVYQLFKKMEELFKKPIIYIPSILLIFANWIWNITKGL